MKPQPMASALILMTSAVTAGDWSGFRGPAGDGISDAIGVPTVWSSDSNVAWKIDLPGRSNGSPIVAGSRVFLDKYAEDDGHKRHLHCFGTDDGTAKWMRTVEYRKTMPTHKTNLYGGTTPATDGTHIVVWHSSAGLYCYDIEGHELWNRELGEFRHMWGYGTSPLLHGGKVILQSGPGKVVFVAAFDVKTGTTIWKADEPVENDGERNDGGKYMGSWSTPVIASVEGKQVAVCSMATRVNGYDLETGKILWSCAGLRGERGDLTYTSPVIADNVVCVAMGGYKGPAIGFQMGGTGDITETRGLWREHRNTPQRIGSGVFVDGYIYMANAGPNTIECIDPATGKSRWLERAGGAHWGSLVYADQKVYATDQNSNTTVFRPNPERLETVATNRLDEPGNSTPAVADGAIYIRTFRHLYRIGSQR